MSEADLRKHGDGSGDIELTVNSTQRLSYWLLWPHARPWQFSPVKPTLRSINNAPAVAAELAKVLQARFPESRRQRAPARETEAQAALDLPSRARAAGAP
jgi:hypothetical protein